MNKLYLMLLIFCILFILSCNSLDKFTPGYWKSKSEFKKELEFVQKILDNPDRMQVIIETSEFYDKNFLIIDNRHYTIYKSCIKLDEDDGAKIIGFKRTSYENKKKNILTKDAKSIFVSKIKSEIKLNFVFIDINNKSTIVGIHFLSN